MRETCETCKFNDDMICKRYPPQMVPYPNDNQHPVIYVPIEVQPAISFGQWCGEYAPKQKTWADLARDIMGEKK